MKLNTFVCISVCGLLGLNIFVQAEENPAPPTPAVEVVAAAEPAAPTPAAAKPAESTPAAQPAEPAPAPAASTQPAGSVTEEPGLIVIDYNEADIQSVLRTLASKAGRNVIMGDEIIGKVTVHLENVPYEEAMQLIAESKGFTCVKDKNVIKVKTLASLEMEPTELKVVTLKYAKADDVKTSLTSLLSRQGKVQVDARSNSLVISETPTSLEKILPLIEALDGQTPQVVIEAKFVETTKNPKKDLGINWSGTLLNHEVTAGGSAVSENPGDPPEVIVDEVNKPLSGFQWVKPFGGGALSPWTAGVALLDAGKATAVFSYLSSDKDTELLANPRVVTTDNGKAKISIATQFPIPQFNFSEQTASLQISGFDYKDIGIILNVTPRVNTDGYITLEVAPEASSSTESTRLSSGGGSSVEIPIVNTRTASTTVIIKSGNTLAIGGLMRVDKDETYTKVPIMGDLPGIGALFRSKALSKMKRDLLIFLTPTIVGPDEQTGYEKYYNGMPAEELYVNDKWMPEDNAKPQPTKPLFRLAAPESKPVPPVEPLPNQNFGPQ